MRDGSSEGGCKLCNPRQKFVYDLSTIIAAAGGSLPSTRGEFSTLGKVGKILICITGYSSIDKAKTEMKELFAGAASVD